MRALVPQATGKEKMMVRIGMTFNDYVDLRIKPWSGAARGPSD